VASDADLWTCPRCGARFVTRNLWHGCGDYSVDGFFEGTPARLRELYDTWVSPVGEFGPFEQVPTKSRIAFMGAGALRGRRAAPEDGLVCGFWLKRRIDSPRFTKVEHLGRTDWIYQFVLRDEDELDDEVRDWIREAYDVGRQTHLSRER
jgi:hypothetical protein